MINIDLDKCIEEIQEFFLMDDRHYFDNLTDYMCYRANQITMIIENNCDSCGYYDDSDYYKEDNEKDNHVNNIK